MKEITRQVIDTHQKVSRQYDTPFALFISLNNSTQWDFEYFFVE